MVVDSAENPKDAKVAFQAEIGANYDVIITENGSDLDIRVEVVTEPNSINILWLFPQYIVITAGEIMCSISIMQFAFEQAPATMRAVVSSCNMLTNAVGNLIDVFVIAALKGVFSSQVFILNHYFTT